MKPEANQSDNANNKGSGRLGNAENIRKASKLGTDDSA